MPAGLALQPLLFSIRTGAQRTGDLRATVDPSCLRAFDGYVGGALELGCCPLEVVRPEFHPATDDRRVLFGSDRPLHVIFKQAEDIRVLKGAYNIGCVTPGAPRIASAVVEDRPFSNDLRMLRLLDEIWAPSTLAADILLAAGLANVQVVPAPPPAGSAIEAVETAGIAWFAGGSATYPGFGARLPRRGSGSHTVFAAHFDHADEEGDAAALLDGYLDLGTDRSCLLLVLAGSDAAFGHLRASVVARGIAAPDQGGLIGIVPPVSGAQQRDVLASVVDFVACTSRFESENRPMLEAMLQGCIPVTVRHSAMCGIVEADHPLLIESERGADGLHQADRASCALAFRAAASLGAAARAALGAQAAQAAQARMPAAVLADRLRTLMAAHHG